MVTLAELKTQALTLPDDQRAVLAAHWQGSLPAFLHDEGAGIAEAIRRDSQFDGDRFACVTLDEFKYWFQEHEKTTPNIFGAD
jgi:hypothetical protein